MRSSKLRHIFCDDNGTILKDIFDRKCCSNQAFSKCSLNIFCKLGALGFKTYFRDVAWINRQETSDKVDSKSLITDQTHLIIASGKSVLQ